MHNHPSGDPQPSADDIHPTHQIVAVGKPLKVAVTII
jgi:DNA repair protein RadC